MRYDISKSVKMLMFRLIWTTNPLSMTCGWRDTRSWVIQPYWAFVTLKRPVPHTLIFVAGHFLRRCIHAFYMPKALSIRNIWGKFPRFDSTIGFDTTTRKFQPPNEMLSMLHLLTGARKLQEMKTWWEVFTEGLEIWRLSKTIKILFYFKRIHNIVQWWWDQLEVLPR